jgi:phosphoribosylanthranilate isomerase
MAADMSDSPTRVKVCCIQSLAEAELALAEGADAIGLVSAMPSGPGMIDEERIAEILAGLPDPRVAYLLTSLSEPDAIIAQHGRCPAGTLQLCDRLEIGTYDDLRSALPGIDLVQVIQVSGEEALAEAARVTPHVDALLLDSGRIGEGEKVLGGTGRVHDWEISRRIREATPLPLWLAGGLRPENVADAIAAVSPQGVDVCSGLRPDGALDRERLRRFCRAARGPGAD